VSSWRHPDSREDSWSRDFYATIGRTLEEGKFHVGFFDDRVRAWDDVTAEQAGPSTGGAVPAHAIQRIVMGDALEPITRAGQRNREEGRIVIVQAVLERRGPGRRHGPRGA
jgi:hypothetical protein